MFVQCMSLSWQCFNLVPFSILISVQYTPTNEHNIYTVTAAISVNSENKQRKTSEIFSNQS